MADRQQRYDEAYKLEGPEDARRLYASWAPDYDDEMVLDHGYTGPRVAAKVMAQIVSNRNASILDVGCGTGLVGEALKAEGFTRIDGLDLVQEMLDQAASKAVYERLIRGNLLEGVSINPSRYDAAISVGTFTHSHVGPNGLDEVFRLVRPGGKALIVVNAQAFFEDGYEQKLNALTTAGRVEITDDREDEIVRQGQIRGRLLTVDVI